MEKIKIKGDNFVKELIKLEPLQLYGLSLSWGINVKEKSAKEIVDEFIGKWSQLNRQERRKFLKFLEELNRENSKQKKVSIESLLKQKLDQKSAYSLRDPVKNDEPSPLDTSDDPNSRVGAESTETSTLGSEINEAI